MKALVIGRAGSGKTAVALELKRRGLNAFDADEVPELSTWIDLANGRPTIVDNTGVIDQTKVDWLWDEAILKNLLVSNDDIFLCGGAGNDLTLGKYFDKIFILDVKAVVQKRRLETRTDNDYGKHPQQITKILEQQTELVRRALDAGATAVDANAPIKKVVDDILEHVG